jgi:two-component system autoinducer 2 sensor kinase/phosphatase LuxQ
VNVRPSTIRKKKKIATYFTRAITLVISVLTFGVLFQSYQFSRQLIDQEVQRTASQTSSLIQGIFDFRLSLLQLHQDSNAMNIDLLHAVLSRSQKQINQYFHAVDQLDLGSTPDVRFISGLNRLIWDDSNAQFYGILPKALQSLLNRVTANSTWRLVKIPSLLEPVYALARKTPMVNSETGELIGYLYVMTVVNNNYNLLEQMRVQSNSENLVLTIGSHVLSETLKGNEPYQAREIIQVPDSQMSLEAYTINRTALRIEGVLTALTVYFVYDNQNILKLKRNFYFGGLFILVATVSLSFVLWRWLHKRIRSEIEKLMLFTHCIVDRGVEHVFHGSKIEEFDLFGRALEHTFRRFSEQEKQFEDLFHFSVSPTIVWAIDGQPIRMNPAANSQFSEEKHTQLFQKLKDMLLPSIKKVSSGEVMNEVVTEFDGRTFRWIISPVVTEGKVDSILAQGQDVTTIAEAERQSRLAKTEAERAANARADFLARMSHEVRTPLNGILGVAQLLRENASDEKQREQLGVLSLCSEHLLAVLNDILDFSKIEQNKFKINPFRFHLIETIHVIERIYRPLCEEKGIEFKIETNVADDIVVLSDQVRLNQIIFNLLNNAVKFTREGAVTISLTLMQREQKEMFHVSVRDTGIGIDHEDVSLIFEPFVQGDKTTIREYGGSGLGLSIVKNLVEMMGGRVSVTSQIGQGSCFEFSIPIEVKQQRSENIAQQPPVDPHRLFEKAPEVLLVEDNQSSAYIAKAFCDKFGLRVTWVTDGEQAIESIKNTKYDLILMDNQLPSTCGIDITDTIRNQLKIDVPIYACTADDAKETQEAFLDAGAEYVLVKPIREENFYVALLHFKNNHRMSMEMTE